jgi:hypothetical protein
MGCDEFYGATATGPLIVGISAPYTNAAVGFPLNFFASITGAAASTLYNCLLNSNSTPSLGGGASSSRLNNCTVTGNSATACGGGLYAGGATNCIVFYNSAAAGPNHNGSTKWREPPGQNSPGTQQHELFPE